MADARSQGTGEEGVHVNVILRCRYVGLFRGIRKARAPAGWRLGPARWGGAPRDASACRTAPRRCDLKNARPAAPCLRPANAQEMAERSSQVIQCNEALREVTLYQSVGGKSMSRTFRYDKARGARPGRRGPGKVSRATGHTSEAGWQLIQHSTAPPAPSSRMKGDFTHAAPVRSPTSPARPTGVWS
jgi:hypothetical protein